jgi:hypothetical protein
MISRFFKQILFIVIMMYGTVFSQSFRLAGQLSGWMTMNPSNSWATQLGVRYLPEMDVEKSLSQKLSLDASLSLNVNGSAWIYSREEIDTFGKLKFYRMWMRLSSSQLEIRLGLQKINFGSATMLRPLMWFDRIDPRDPLQITDGVWGFLSRYYFLNNANIWVWGLYGNNDTKGWEFVPTAKKKPEFGGRIQIPVPKGEFALTYHHRLMDLEKGIENVLALAGLPEMPASVISEFVDLGIVREDRYGIDGKWDMELGFWFEGAVIRQDIDWLPQKYQRMINTGADYTIGVGNGLYIAYEHFWFHLSEEAFTRGDGFEFSALSLSYPLSLLDNLTGMVYYDWENQEWYRFISFQRTYDRWQVFLMCFWNPEQFQIYPTIQDNSFLAGKGFQVMVVFNH